MKATLLKHQVDLDSELGLLKAYQVPSILQLQGKRTVIDVAHTFSSKKFIPTLFNVSIINIVLIV